MRTKPSIKKSSKKSSGNPSESDETNLIKLLIEFRSHHELKIEQLSKGWKSKKLKSHALLVTGIDGIGKLEFGRILASTLFCTETTSCLFNSTLDPNLVNDIESCGFCSQCRNILRGSDTVFYREIAVLNLESSESTANTEETSSGKSQKLKIDQFRNLHGEARFYDPRLIHVPLAENMTPQAANSLLKLLEEPPPQWKFLLSTRDPSLLLPTILSRCQIVRLLPFQPLDLERSIRRLKSETKDEPENDLKNDLKNDMRSQDISLAIALSHGSLKRALSTLDPNLKDLFEKADTFWKNPLSTYAELVDYLSKNDQHVEILLNTFESRCAQEIRTVLDPHSKAKKSNTPERLIRFSERLARARSEIQIPLNRKLLIQDILGEWMPRS